MLTTSVAICRASRNILRLSKSLARRLASMLPVCQALLRKFSPLSFNSQLSILNSNMALIKSYRGLSPKWGKDCYFSENATIVGDVTMGDECSIWFNAVVRGDVAPITIGNCTNVQDGSCIHVTHETGPTHIGNYVTIGHNVTVHACTIHDHALIGMGATLLDGCEIGEGAIVAAGALVLQNTKIGPNEIWGGVPAKYIKPTRPGQTDNAEHYVAYSKIYMEENPDCRF